MPKHAPQRLLDLLSYTVTEEQPSLAEQISQLVQALEHVRLFPSPRKLFRKDQFVVFERRRCQVIESEMGPQLHPTQDNKRITYKSLITGSIKHDPQFGLFAGQTNGALNQETRVIKLNSISDICDDKREVARSSLTVERLATPKSTW
ncbi:hypothetical protein BK649_20065 [Pseudomonas canadensis]|uniref:Uncharacterized protein n=2 Tax=Pseudomonas canadensis TaxID=915099 RepID=A0A423F1L1_9PSED|nr:hypothetical protein BK649_20065 [Pseudomonas canadensis]